MLKKNVSANIQTAETVRAKAQDKWEKLTDEDFDSIKSNVIELATRLQARYGLSADEAKKQAEEFMDEVSVAAVDAYQGATEALDRAARRVDQVVKDNAWATVGGALLLGGVIGFLMGSERRRSYW